MPSRVPRFAAVQTTRARSGWRSSRAFAVAIADPDGRHDVGREADEPGVAVVLGRAGLSGDRPASGELSGLAGAGADDAGEHLVLDRCEVRVEDPMRVGVVRNALLGPLR